MSSNNIQPVNNSTNQHPPKLTIGLFGFGVVGESLYRVLQEHPTFSATVKKVCIRQVHKPRNAPIRLFTTNHLDLLDDPEINVIVELIDDADAAFLVAREALTRGKAVVSANKKTIAQHLPELLALQQKHGAPFLYEGACCASIPVIRNLEEYYDNDLLQGFEGIVNGSTNYILTRIAEDGLDFPTALKEAQEAGFAESNPHLDISGQDAANKLAILLCHAYGIVGSPASLVYQGIAQIDAADARLAEQTGQRIRLVASARKLDDGKVSAHLLPTFVGPESQLYNVRNEYNGIQIESGFAETQFFYGKGAGGYATASAVLSDLSALRYDYRYEYKKLYKQAPATLSYDATLHVYVSCDDLGRLPEEAFSAIHHWGYADGRAYVVGEISLESLRHDRWWQRKGFSLIVCGPDFAGKLRRRGAKKQTQELAVPA